MKMGIVTIGRQMLPVFISPVGGLGSSSNMLPNSRENKSVPFQLALRLYDLRFSISTNYYMTEKAHLFIDSHRNFLLRFKNFRPSVPHHPPT